MEKFGRTKLGNDQIILRISAFVRNLARWSRILNCRCTGVVRFWPKTEIKSNSRLLNWKKRLRLALEGLKWGHSIKF